MLQEELLLMLDDLAAPDRYVAPSTCEDLAYVVSFRQACKRNGINFVSADQDKRDFIIHLAENDLAQKREAAEKAEDIQDTVQAVQSLVGAIPYTDLPLSKLREERLEKYNAY